MKEKISGPLFIANSRLIVKKVKKVPVFFPLNYFLFIERFVERSPGLSLASRERLTCFFKLSDDSSFESTEAYLAREVVGAITCEFLQGERLDIVDLPSKEAWQWFFGFGHFSSWRDIGEFEQSKRRELPWGASRYWRLGLTSEGQLFLQHFRE